MKKFVLACLILSLLSPISSAQRPIRQLLPLRAYTLQDYHAVAFQEAFALPASIEASSYAGVAMNARDNLVILSRGTPTFLEFEKDGSTDTGSALIAINVRHQDCLRRAESGLQETLAMLSAGEEPEFISLPLREALMAVGEIAGRIDTEDILGSIFGQFCIGK